MNPVLNPVGANIASQAFDSAQSAQAGQVTTITTAETLAFGTRSVATGSDYPKAILEKQSDDGQSSSLGSGMIVLAEPVGKKAAYSAEVKYDKSGRAEKYPVFDEKQFRSFRDYINIQTKDLHKESSEDVFIQSLLKGKATKQAYSGYIGRKGIIYQHLEKLAQGIEKTDNSAWALAGNFAGSGALNEDYKALTGCEIPKQQILGSAKLLSEYIRHLETIGNEEFPLKEIKLSANFFVHFGGDLAGGQILYNRLANKCGWEPEVLNHFNFGEQTKSLRNALHDLVNTIPSRYHGLGAVFLDEAIRVYEYVIAFGEEYSLSLPSVKE